MPYKIQQFSKTSRADMARIFLAAELLIEEWVGRDTRGFDVHHITCSRLCDEFDVWEVVEVKPKPGVKYIQDPTEVNIPTWLMYMVAGVMRDKGVTS